MWVSVESERGMGYNKLVKELDFNKRGGQAALSLVLLVGGTVVLIAATLFFLVISFLNSNFGFQAANRAWGLAVAGLNDGLLQLTRNPVIDYLFYDVDLDGQAVTVKICNSDQFQLQCGAPLPSHQASIDSYSTVSGRLRRIRAYVSVSAEGKVEVISIEQSFESSEGGQG